MIEDLLPRPARGAGSEPIETPPVADDRQESESVEDVDEAEADEEVLQKAKAYFASHTGRTWVDYVTAEQEAVDAKTARLRAARLARITQTDSP